MPFVYLLRCSDNSFYVGHTDDLIAREHAHNEGTGAQYTACRRPVMLIYSETFESLATREPPMTAEGLLT
jgi:predicted GIY-YIG superfamily endonuclease